MFLSAPSERPANLLPSLSNFDPADGFCNELIEALPRLKLLVDNYEELRDEFRAVFSQLETVNWGADDENDTGYFGEKKLAKHDGYWKNIPLYGQGKEFEDLAKKEGLKVIRNSTEVQTTLNEQRQTKWMPFKSYESAILETNQDRTVENFSAPKRKFYVLERLS